MRQHLVMVSFCLNDNLNSSIDAGIKWRPTPSEVAEFGPEFQKYWESHFANAPDKPVLWMGISSSYVLKTKRLSMDSSSTVVQVRGRSQSGPSTQILHRSCIHCEPPISYLPVATRATFSCQRAQAYPLARGHVHITHADDASAPEDFVPHFFESFVTIHPRSQIASLTDRFFFKPVRRTCGR